MNHVRRGALGAVIAVVAALVGVLVAPSVGAAPVTGEQGTPLCSTPLPGHFRCASLALPAPNSPAVSTNGYRGFQATDIEALYGTSAIAGLAPTSSSPVVAIVDAYGYPGSGPEADLATYRKQNGLPACTVANGCLTRYDQRGGTTYPVADEGWAEETALDLDAVSATCPACRIMLVEADSSSDGDLMSAITTAVGLGAKYISLSWGAPDGDMSRASATAYDKAYFAASGVTYVAATGDDGYAPGPNYPATSSNVVAVGGTDVNPGSAAGTYTSTAWGYQDAGGSWVGAGSGCSAVESVPSYQKKTAASDACGATRAASDVSAMADSDTEPFRIIFEGDEQFVGGTSEATPIIAALYASTGEAAGSAKGAVQAYVYKNAAGLTDVTTGANGTCSPAGLCSAASGWDGPTGMGTPASPAGLYPSAVSGVTVPSPGKQTSYAGQQVSVSVAATVTGAISASSGPLSYTATGLPSGVKLGSDGLITGAAKKVGAFSVTVVAKNKVARGTRSFTWTVKAAKVVPASTPKITGKAARGQTVKLTAMSWKLPVGTALKPKVSYQWYLDGKPIKGATRSSFAIPRSESFSKKRLTVKITVKATANYSSYSHVTAGTAAIT